MLAVLWPTLLSRGNSELLSASQLLSVFRTYWSAFTSKDVGSAPVVDPGSLKARARAAQRLLAEGYDGQEANASAFFAPESLTKRHVLRTLLLQSVAGRLHELSFRSVAGFLKILCSPPTASYHPSETNESSAGLLTTATLLDDTQHQLLRTALETKLGSDTTTMRDALTREFGRGEDAAGLCIDFLAGLCFLKVDPNHVVFSCLLHVLGTRGTVEEDHGETKKTPNEMPARRVELSPSQMLQLCHVFGGNVACVEHLVSDLLSEGGSWNRPRLDTLKLITVQDQIKLIAALKNRAPDRFVAQIVGVLLRELQQAEVSEVYLPSSSVFGAGASSTGSRLPVRCGNGASSSVPAADWETVVACLDVTVLHML